MINNKPYIIYIIAFWVFWIWFSYGTLRVFVEYGDIDAIVIILTTIISLLITIVTWITIRNLAKGDNIINNRAGA